MEQLALKAAARLVEQLQAAVLLVEQPAVLLVEQAAEQLVEPLARAVVLLVVRPPCTASSLHHPSLLFSHTLSTEPCEQTPRAVGCGGGAPNGGRGGADWCAEAPIL